MYKSLAVITLIVHTNLVHAAGGFTWLSSVSHATHLPEHTLTLLMIGLIVLSFGLIYRSSLTKISNSVIPDRGITVRNFVEAYGQFIMNQCRAIIGEKEGPKYFSFIATIFILILLCNLVGLVPGFLPPTEFMSTTLALGILSFAYYNIKGCQAQGVVNYLKHFCGPLWYMAILILPIEIVSNLVRPMSLALRLKGNMSGDHLIFEIFSNLTPLIIPIAFMFLGLLVSLVQAYVFTILSMVYISLAVAHHDHGEEHGHH